MDKGKEHGPTVACSKGRLLPVIRTAMANVEAPQVSRACVDMLTASSWVGYPDTQFGFHRGEIGS